MTLRFVCCQLNPEPFFAGPGSAPLPLGWNDPCGSCLSEDTKMSMSLLWEFRGGAEVKGKG